LEFWNESIKQPPDLTLFYERELLELSQLSNTDQLTNSEFLEANPFVASAIKNKFIVKLSRFGYNLIKAFIVDNELLYVSTVLNEKIQFQLYETPVDSRLPCQPSSILSSTSNPNHHPLLPLSPSFIIPHIHPLSYELNAKSKTNSDSIKMGSQLPSIHLAVPGKAPLSVPTLENIKPQHGEDLILNELLMKIVRPRLLLNSKRIRDTHLSETATGGEKSSSEKSYIHNQWLHPEQRGLTVGDALQPSVLFTTMSNTYNGLICMDISADGTQVVAGFQNHSVCVFNLANQSSNTSGRGATLSGSSSSSSAMKMPRKDKEKDEHVRTHRQAAVDHLLNIIFPKPKSQFETAIQVITNGNKKSGIGSNNGVISDNCNSHESDSQFIDFFGHSRPVYGVSQSVSGKVVLSASADETVRLWDVNMRQSVAKYNLQSVVWDVKFNQVFETYFATANQNSSLFVYSTNRMSPVRVFTGHVSSANCVAWSDNGFVLCSGSDDRTCRVWDFRQGSCARVLTGLQTAARCIAISADGRLLASGTDSGMIYVYDMLTSTLLGVLQGHRNAVTSVSFSADTTALVSGGLDCAVRVWNLSKLIEQFSSSAAPERPLISMSINDSNTAATATSMTTTATSTATSSSEMQSQNLTKSTIPDEASTYSHRFQSQSNFSENDNLNFFRMLPTNVNVLTSLHCFHTKHTPVHYVKYSPFNLVTAGGPFSMESDLSDL